MPKMYDDIFDCVCPFCGKKGILLNASRERPEFYCEKDKLWYQYRKMDVFSFKTWLSVPKYYLRYSERTKQCKKHNTAYDDMRDNLAIDRFCSGCKTDRTTAKLLRDLNRLKFTKDQIAFLHDTNKYNINELLEDLYPNLKKEDD